LRSLFRNGGGEASPFAGPRPKAVNIRVKILESSLEKLASAAKESKLKDFTRKQQLIITGRDKSAESPIHETGKQRGRQLR